MKLTKLQKDRAGGVLLGQAIGDALGVPYEFQAPVKPGQARMIGGGLGPYEPGEWSDDTQMACCIADVAARGKGLATEDSLRSVAENFCNWLSHGASDRGAQIGAVVGSAVGSTDVLAAMHKASKRAADQDRAGNGALMRTSIVGLVALEDPQATADAAAKVAALTHSHPLCVESCILWSEAVRVAVVEGRLALRQGLWLLPPDRRDVWSDWLDDAELAKSGTQFGRNGFTVTALQAAWWAIWSTIDLRGPDHVEAALQAAISIGHDTDTIAAIAGGLLGAMYGVSGLASDLARRVHGWPGLGAPDLIEAALRTALPGLEITHHLAAGPSRPLNLPHPDDPGVILGVHADLRADHREWTAVVSLSRLGADDVNAAGVEPGKHAQIRLLDSENPADNAHLAWTIADAARTVAALRDAGETVLLHCVAAHHRTPSVALAYSKLRGLGDGAPERIQRALGRRIDGLLWSTSLSL